MANPTVVIQVEGVLRKPVTGAVIDNGRRLYHGLASTFRLVLVSEGDTAGYKSYLDTWLSMEGFTKHDHIVYSGEWRPRADNWWVGTAGTLKLRYGYNTELFVVPDPSDAAALIEHGHNTLLFTIAAYALPEWRPDHPVVVRAWDGMMRVIDTEKARRAADKRMEKGVE